MNDVVTWIQQNVVAVIALIGVLSGTVFGLYRFVRKTELKIKRIDLNAELLETMQKNINMHTEQLDKGTDKFKSLEADVQRATKELSTLSEKTESTNTYLESMDMKLGAIVGFLVNEPQSTEDIRVINEGYKKRRRNELQG